MRNQLLVWIISAWLLLIGGMRAHAQSAQPPAAQPPAAQPPAQPPKAQPAPQVPAPPTPGAPTPGMPPGSQTKKDEGSPMLNYALAGLAVIVVMVLVCMPARRD